MRSRRVTDLMAKRPLKVFRTAAGFQDAYVAATSQKAALEAWGSKTNLFAGGLAELVTDPKLTKAALAQPGVVIRVARGTAAQHLAAAGKQKAPAGKARVDDAAELEEEKAAPPKPKRRKPKPRRAAFERAEAALEKARKTHADALVAIDARIADLPRSATSCDRRATQSLGNLRTGLAEKRRLIDPRSTPGKDSTTNRRRDWRQRARVPWAVSDGGG